MTEPDDQPRSPVRVGKRHLRGRRRDARGLRPDRQAGHLRPGRGGVRQGADSAGACVAASVSAAARSTRRLPGQDGTVWKPQTMWMPRFSAAYKLGEKTVLKAGYGIYYDTLNAADYTPNNRATARRRPTPTARTSARRSSSAIRTRASWASPIRSRCGPTGPASTSRSGRRSASTRSSARATRSEPEPRARAPAEVADRGPARGGQEPVGGGVLRRRSYSDRIEVSIRQDYLPQRYWIPAA